MKKEFVQLTEDLSQWVNWTAHTGKLAWDANPPALWSPHWCWEQNGSSPIAVVLCTWPFYFSSLGACSRPHWWSVSQWVNKSCFLTHIPQASQIWENKKPNMPIRNNRRLTNHKELGWWCWIRGLCWRASASITQCSFSVNILRMEALDSRSRQLFPSKSIGPIVVYSPGFCFAVSSVYFLLLYFFWLIFLPPGKQNSLQ